MPRLLRILNASIFRIAAKTGTATARAMRHQVIHVVLTEIDEDDSV